MSGDCGEVEGLSGWFAGLVEEKDANVLALCAKLGAQDTEYQTALRDAVLGQKSTSDKLAQADKLLSGKKFLGGDAPNEADAKLFSGVFPVVGLLMKPADRAKYPSLDTWLENCVSREGMSDIHLLGTVRIGDQIDQFACSRHVRSMADKSNALNSGVKKKKTQRQLEKEARAMVVPEPTEFQFVDCGIPCDAGNEQKISSLQNALKKIGVKGPHDIVHHKAAHTMAEMPKELESKAGYVCKNLFLKSKKPRKGVENDSCIWLVSVPNDAVVDMKALTQQLGYKGELRQADEKMLLSTLGVQPGCVTPFGLVNDKDIKVNVVLDEDMMSKKENVLWFHPMTNESTMGITAGDLYTFMAATSRKATLIKFARKTQEESAPAAATTAAPLKLSHEDARKRLWDKLTAMGLEPRKEVDPDPNAKRPVGHSTHNLFVKDKKAKKLYLVSMRQSVDANLKDIAKKLGAKEVRFASNSAECMCLEKGCITLLSLYNNVQGDVTPAIDTQLFSGNQPLRMCAGCDDPLNHLQHNIVDITPDQLKTLLAESGTPPTIPLEL
eukprot:CAMPEP_0203762872 /NCGR_PEP_ID=MMETSP0098-20131031/15659_1 /ASSEMBLY_ACC=CAM_ASM_000208 /TAXON_ID=96639 /ORGANISM=" , Strain NY0313808BC1" /LENGTH=552 /DNA_ID=CAMNT_0050657453 /DNA_START=148 /DNA_END=1806 /DNA_ORIENTATION=-